MIKYNIMIAYESTFHQFTIKSSPHVGFIHNKVAGHIPAQISDVPSWDAETIFFYKF
jgi:hypothetical protein